MYMNNFEKKIEQFNGLYRLNLAIEEENEYYLESIGGEENLKNNYPMLYKSYQNARKMAKNSKQRKTQIDISDIHFRTYDIMAVDKPVEGMGEAQRFFLSMGLTGSFLYTNSKNENSDEPTKSFSVSVNGKLYDPQSSRLAFICVNDSYQQVNQVDAHFYSENAFNQEEFWDKDLKACFTISVYDDDDMLTPFVSVETKRFGKPMNFAIDNISLAAPLSKNSQTNEIRILYGRSALNLDRPDYIYESNNADKQNGQLRTIVPMKGEVRLKSVLTGKSYYSFEKLTKPIDGELWGRSTLQYANKDWKIYRSDLIDDNLYDALVANNFSVQHSENHVETLHFDLFNSTYPEGSDCRYDWAADIDKASTDNKERICYLVGGFEYDICKKNKNGEIVEPGVSYQIEIHSINPENLPAGRTYYTFSAGSTTIYIPPIHLWWGCYAKNTKIQMADGRVVRIDEIKMGDLLLCYGDKMLKVDNIIYGYEAYLIRVETDNGNSICVSKEHPILLADGKGKSAEELVIGDELLMQGQTHDKIKSISRVEYNDEVYNLMFQGEKNGTYLIANKFYAGDFNLQNNLETTPERTAEKKRKLDEELKELRSHLNGNKY